MKSRYDKMFLGLLSGVFAPTVIFFAIYMVKYAGEYTLQEIIAQIKTLDLGAKIIALTVFLANIVLFYAMYRLRWDKFCKGVLLATFLYAFLIFTMKF